MKKPDLYNLGPILDLLIATSLSVAGVHLLEMELRWAMRLPSVSPSTYPLSIGVCSLLVSAIVLFILRNGFILCLFGWFIAYLMISTFRGDMLWFGTFDLYADPKLIWLRPALIGGASGAAIGAVARWLLKQGLSARSQMIATVSSVALLCVVSVVYSTLLLSSPMAPWSAFAPTRHYALGLVSVLCVGSVVCIRVMLVNKSAQLR